MPLCSFRRTSVASIDAWLSTAARAWTWGRLHAVENNAVVSEDAISLRAFARAGHLARPVVTLLLDGVARISFGDEHHWLAPGDALVMPEKSPLAMRQEGAPYRSLVFEWEAGRFGVAPARIRRLRVRDEALAPLRAFSTELREPDASLAPLEGYFEALASAGLAFGRERRELDEAVPARQQQLCASLDALLSKLDEETLKSQLDEQMGLSARQFQRLVVEFHARYGFNATNWVDARNRRRLLLGVAFMTVPGATARAVAPALGFTSPAAFSKALANAGLPRPSEVAAVVASMRSGDVRK